ncbi:hypothetical protein VCBJG01_1707, partial [Vibrio cholerae BJG-01]
MRCWLTTDFDTLSLSAGAE